MRRPWIGAGVGIEIAGELSMARIRALSISRVVFDTHKSYVQVSTTIPTAHIVMTDAIAPILPKLSEPSLRKFRSFLRFLITPATAEMRRSEPYHLLHPAHIDQEFF